MPESESEPDSPGLEVSRVALSRKFYSDTKKTLRKARHDSGKEELGWRQALDVVRKGIKRTVVSKSIASLIAVAKKDDTLDIQNEVDALKSLRNLSSLEDMHEPIKGIIRKSFWAVDLDSEQERKKAAEKEAEIYANALKNVTESLTRLDDDLASTMHDTQELRKSIADLEDSFSQIGIALQPLMAQVQDTLQALQATEGNYQQQPDSSDSESEDGNAETVFSDSSEAETSHDAHRDSDVKPLFVNREAVKAVTKFRRLIARNRLSGDPSQRAARMALSKVQGLVRAIVTNQILLRLRSGNADTFAQEAETYLGSRAAASRSPSADRNTEARGALEHERPGAISHSACTVQVSERTIGTSLRNAQHTQKPLEHLRSPDVKNAGPSAGRRISWVREEMTGLGVLPAQTVPSASPSARDSSHELFGQADGPKLAALLQARNKHDACRQPVEDFSGSKLKHRVEPASWPASKQISSHTTSEHLFGFKQKAPSRNPALSYAIRRYHTVVVQDDGKAVAYGRNSECQCDIPETTDDLGTSSLFQTEVAQTSGPAFVNESNRPGESAVIAADGDDTCAQAAAGHFHTILLRSDGTAVARGQNAQHQCDIPRLFGNSTYTQVAAGDFHTVLLRSDGTAASCGRNAERQCDIPPLQGNLTYTKVTAGRGSTVLLRSDGNVFCCGAAARSWGPVIPKQELELLGLGDSIEKLIHRMGL